MSTDLFICNKRNISCCLLKMQNSDLRRRCDSTMGVSGLQNLGNTVSLLIGQFKTYAWLSATESNLRLHFFENSCFLPAMHFVINENAIQYNTSVSIFYCNKTLMIVYRYLILL